MIALVGKELNGMNLALSTATSNLFLFPIRHGTRPRERGGDTGLVVPALRLACGACPPESLPPPPPSGCLVWWRRW